MKRHFVITVLAAVTVSAPLAARLAAAQAGPAPAPAAAPAATAAAPVEVQAGTATFDVGTNVPAISVHGKSTNVRGRAVIRQTANAIALEQMEATVPVKTIETGLGLRDEHMRKYIFTTADGQLPDVKFVSDKAECSPASGGESTCNVSGNLTIRGTARPFAIALKVKKAGEAYSAEGDSAVKLSTFGIDRPSQFGVSTADDVKLHLEFTATPAATAAAARPGGIR